MASNSTSNPGILSIQFGSLLLSGPIPSGNPVSLPQLASQPPTEVSEVPASSDGSSSEDDEPWRVEIIDLVPDGDLLFGMSNFRYPDISRFFVFNVLHALNPMKYPRIWYFGLPDEIQVRVDSKMLCFLGKFFPVILNPNGKKDFAADGKTRIYSDPDDCAEAGLYVLLAKFGRFDLGPINKYHYVSLELLCDLLIFIDKYGLRRSMDAELAVWDRPFVTRPITRIYNNVKDIETGLCVAHKLRNQDLLEHVLRGHFTNSTTSLLMMDKPFPDIQLKIINDGLVYLRDLFREELTDLVRRHGTGESFCCLDKPGCTRWARRKFINTLNESTFFIGQHVSALKVILPADKTVVEGLDELWALPLNRLCRHTNQRSTRNAPEARTDPVSNIARKIKREIDEVVRRSTMGRRPIRWY